MGKITYSVMPRTKKGVSKEKAEEVRHYVQTTGHRAKVVKIGDNKYRVYTSSPSLRTPRRKKTRKSRGRRR